MRFPRARGLLLLLIAAAAGLSAWHLSLAPAGLWPSAAGWQQLGRFSAAAFSPALHSQSDLGTPLLPQVLSAALETLAFALAATSLSLVVGSVLGVGCSRRWWRMSRVAPVLAAPCYVVARALIAFMRSIHEVLWALLLLAALGLNPAAAVLAIAIPYAGTLAKVFSELLDEAPEDTADALALAGAAPLAVFAWGVLPRVLPDVGAYAFYRFECALRSAAILGFFGFPTLGKRIFEATSELHYQEAWTYLYALIALVVVVEGWSAALRQRLTVA